MQNRVLFVDPPVTRATLLAHAGSFSSIELAIKLHRAGPEKVSDSLFVYRPPAILLPFGHVDAVDRVSRRRLMQALATAATTLGFDRPIVWAYDPFAFDADGSLGEKIVCYDCNDDISSFARFNYKRNNLRRREEAFCKSADLVFATSRNLFKMKQQLNPNSYYFPSGVDFDLLQKALDQSYPVPLDVACLPTPRIGYVGGIANYRIEWGWIRALAHARPQWSIVFVGPERERPPAEVRNLRNVLFLGARTPQELPGYIKAFDVCIIPYKGREFLQSCQPTKTFEYLAIGKPVVSSIIPELAEHAGIIDMVSSALEFQQAVEAAIGKGRDSNHVARCVSAAQPHTWDARLVETSFLIERLLDEPPRLPAGKKAQECNALG